MRQLEDGIAHDLSRPMVRDRAATIDELETRTCAAEDLFSAVPMCRLGGAAQGIDRQVLKEQQDIPLFLRNPCLSVVASGVPKLRYRGSAAEIERVYLLAGSASGEVSLLCQEKAWDRCDPSTSLTERPSAVWILNRDRGLRRSFRWRR